MWYEPSSNLVVYDTPEGAKILERVPTAKKLYNGYVAAPATLWNLQVLRHLGHPVPPIMDATYDWPGQFKPFDSQRVTANFLALHPRAFVLSDMGTGKTLSALWAADYVMRAHPGVRCLIVAPLSTLQRVWADAIFQNLIGRRKSVVLYGDAATRKRLLSTDADFYVVNYDGLGVLSAELAKRSDIRLVIVDEASAYKDRATKRHRLARQLLMGKDYLWLMTGTPTPNGPLDAYGLAKLVNNAFGESFISYQSRTMAKISMWKWVPKTGAHTQAMKLLQPSVRFSIEDCVDLPSCTTQRRDVELSSEQAKAFREMKRDAVLQTKAGPITAAHEAVLRLKLIQIACGEIYVGAGLHNGARRVHSIDSGPRLSVLKEVIAECQHKIIVFAPLTSVCNMLVTELGKSHTVRLVNGQTPQKERNEIFRGFQQDNSPRILVADPGTMAHGLTLTAASTIVWYAPTDRTELYLQANKRIDRPGQVNSTSIVQLAATRIEREIYRRLEANESMMGLMLQLVREGSDE